MSKQGGHLKKVPHEKEADKQQCNIRMQVKQHATKSYVQVGGIDV